jgi:hypothetical protein
MADFPAMSSQSENWCIEGWGCEVGHAEVSSWGGRSKRVWRKEGRGRRRGFNGCKWGLLDIYVILLEVLLIKKHILMLSIYYMIVLYMWRKWRDGMTYSCLVIGKTWAVGIGKMKLPNMPNKITSREIDGLVNYSNWCPNLTAHKLGSGEFEATNYTLPN